MSWSRGSEEHGVDVEVGGEQGEAREELVRCLDDELVMPHEAR